MGIDVDLGYVQFLNIPFAQLPLGDLRFAALEPLPAIAAEWDIDSSEVGPKCLQQEPPS